MGIGGHDTRSIQGCIRTILSDEFFLEVDCEKGKVTKGKVLLRSR